jgi:GMP synthase (glutamine-hydrolysing)
MILIINICRHELHYFEFVKPVEDIVVDAGLKYSVIHIEHLNKSHLDSAERIIICGTSLRDFDFEKKDFSWIQKFDKPLLGICAGFQIICESYGFKTKKGIEIGLKNISFDKNFLGLEGNKQVYCLHNNVIEKDAKFAKEFGVYSNSKHIQAIKKNTHPIYGTLFHPEVRNKKVIENFLYA